MIVLFQVLRVFTLLSLCACTYSSREYRDFYHHLNSFQCQHSSMQEDEFFLVILVDACHLDYTDTFRFFQSVAVPPRTGCRRGELGHAWIYLQGKRKDGTLFVLEGGHSGERTDYPAKYFDGIMNYNDWGYANPTEKQMKVPRYEPNPIKYLWTLRKDGFFQKGSGGHVPTFAAKISLTSQQFEEILSFVKPSQYPYQSYGLMGPQCCSFVVKIARLVGLSLCADTAMQISPAIEFRRAWIRLWEDPRYSIIRFSTPDILEKNLMDAVENGDADYALDWYLNE